MHRRTYLTTFAVATTVALAGCGGTDESGEQTAAAETTSTMTSVAEGTSEETTTTAAEEVKATTTTMTTTDGTQTAKAEPTIETPQPTEVEVETPSATTVSGQKDDAYYGMLISTALQQTDVSVTTIISEGEVVRLSYTTSQTTEEGLAEEIGKVMGAFASAIGDGWDKQQLLASILVPDGTEIGRFHIQREWAHQYITGEITAEEYATKVLQTVESTS